MKGKREITEWRAEGIQKYEVRFPGPMHMVATIHGLMRIRVKGMRIDCKLIGKVLTSWLWHCGLWGLPSCITRCNSRVTRVVEWWLVTEEDRRGRKEHTRVRVHSNSAFTKNSEERPTHASTHASTQGKGQKRDKGRASMWYQYAYYA